MRKISELIFVFIIAAGLLVGVHLALALDAEKSIQEIKTIADADWLGQYAIDKISDKPIEALKDKLKRQTPEVYEENGTKADSRYALLGIGGMTLDPQPGPPKPAASETPKEPGISPPAEPLTHQPEPQGVGAEPPTPVVTPREVPRREQVKEETGSAKPVASKEAPNKGKEKGKTTAKRAKTAKHVKPKSRKTVEKPSETSIGQDKARMKHPTAVDVTKSLGSPPKPETKKPMIPSTR